MKLAIKGGQPVRKEFLSFNKPYVTEEGINEVLDTIRSGWLTTGPKVIKLEEGLKNYIGCKHALAVNSGTSALLLALEAAGIKRGDEVITTPNTWLATSHVVDLLGAKPVFVDVESEMFNIDSELIKAAVNKKTKAILPVHLAGRPCEMDTIMEIAESNNLFVIEDAAHALEAEYKNKKIGTIGDLTCFSFYATKNLFLGEGGMVTTNNDEFAEKLGISRFFGLDKYAWKRYTSSGFKPYDVRLLGHKCNLSDLHAALGLHQINKIEERWLVRKKMFSKYNELLANIPQIVLPPQDKKYFKNAYHLYSILVKPELLKCNRNEFAAALQAENIGIGVHFLALHLTKYYRERYGYKVGEFPHAEFFSDRTLSLPFNPFMSNKDIEDVVTAIKKVVEYYKK